MTVVENRFGKKSLKMVESQPRELLAVNNSKYVKECSELYLANKKIEKIANFECFCNLNELYLNNNKITNVNSLEPCVRLKGLFLQNNRIISLHDSCLPSLKVLERLNLANNRIKDLDSTIECLFKLKKLKTLDLSGNPVSEVLNYRFIIIHHISWLKILDCKEISADEKRKAVRIFSTNEAPISKAVSEKVTTGLYEDLCLEATLIKAKLSKTKQDRERSEYTLSFRDIPSEPPEPEGKHPETVEEKQNRLNRLEKLVELKRVLKDKLDASVIPSLMNSLILSTRPKPDLVESLCARWIAETKKLKLESVILDLLNLEWEDFDFNWNEKDTSAESILAATLLLKQKSQVEKDICFSNPAVKVPMHDQYSFYSTKIIQDEIPETESIKLTENTLKRLQLSSLSRREIETRGIFANAPHPIEVRKTISTANVTKSIKLSEEERLVRELQTENDTD